MKIKVRVTDLSKLEKDPNYNGHIEEREYSNPEGRHRYLCVSCGWSTYPSCREWCPNGGEGYRVEDDILYKENQDEN